MLSSASKLEVWVGDGLEELGPREFLSLVSDLVRASKGIEIELREADILVESQEFRREFRQEVQRLLGHYERRR